ncbi:MAG: hypothetical protein WC707_03180 [Candidatus Babeliaceae bacterium]|jgi:DNA mismatch repair ATPase MutS
MIISKKLVTALFIAIAAAHTHAADPVVADYSSGKNKITSIMSHEETGVSAYNKEHIAYADTENISNDLNIPEIANFFDCKTLIGQSFIAETLKHPVSPQDKNSVLANRQNAIRALVENPELKKEVEQLIEAAYQEEQEVVKLMSDFFKGQTCPELQQLEVIKKQTPKMYPIYEFFYLNPTGNIIGTAYNLTNFTGYFIGTCLAGKTIYQSARAGIDYFEPAKGVLGCGLVSSLFAYNLHKDYSLASGKRVKMHALNCMIAIAEKLDALCVKHNIKNQFTVSAIKDPNALELMQALKHPRYQNKKALLFMTPMVHTFLYKVYQQEKHLAGVLASIAEMDAYNAIATKIIESNTTNNKLCFVTFVDDAQPVVRAQKFWNLLVKNAVPNNISEQKNIILTGPNAGGKTTAIRAILQNIVLGQTFGVAAAETFEATMFDVVHSYLNISDNILNGLSLFASEVKRAQDILQTIKTLQPDTKFFFALDELFTGTVAEDGEACAYEFVKRIAALDNVQFIYATHFNKLKELGKASPLCANYKVDAPIKNADDKLVYPFTLSPGASNARVALDIAREAQLFA